METRIRELISEAEAGSAVASEQLFAALYAELHRLADVQLRRMGPELSLVTTTLLHEAYLDLAGREGVRFTDRARFLGYAARAMRGLVIDYARRARAKKRGGGAFEITLAEEGTRRRPVRAVRRSSCSASPTSSTSWPGSSRRWRSSWTCTSSAATPSPRSPRCHVPGVTPPPRERTRRQAPVTRMGGGRSA